MRVLLVHGDLRAGGGAEDYARAIQSGLCALGHVVDTLDIHGLGSSSRHHDPLIFRAARRFPVLKHLHLAKYALVCRCAPRLSIDYDMVFLTYGEGPRFVQPTLRLLHAPALFSSETRYLQYLGADTGGPLRRIVRRAYVGLCRAVAQPVTTFERDALPTLTNSAWTQAEVLRAQPSTDCRILRPPFAVENALPTVRRPACHIVALGRIAPAKRLEDAIAIVAALRARGHPCILTIIGRGTSAYARRFIPNAKRLGFVRVLCNADDATRNDALATARIGLHCNRCEHFGIAIAQMIGAGCLPVVFDGGGVAELVTDPLLRFGDLAEAVTEIETLIAASESRCAETIDQLRTTPAFIEATQFPKTFARLFQSIATTMQDAA